MANEPKHVEKEDISFTREAKYILSSWQEFTNQAEKRSQEEMINVSETFGFVAYLYEKLRTSVEYRGEHVLRRASIERSLKRILYLNKTNEEKAEMIVNELTWSRFLPNESVPKSKLPELKLILDKYDHLIAYTQNSEFPAEKMNWETWLLGIASTEIEEALTPSYLRSYLAPLMFSWLQKHFDWDTETISDDDREIQLFIAAQRALAKSDLPILRYRLLLLMNPEWNKKQVEIQSLQESLPHLGSEIERLLNHPQKNQVFRFVQKFTPVFIFLFEILRASNEPEKIINNPEVLEAATHKIAEEKYTKLRSQINSAIVRSIVYLVITKVIIALILELPYEIYILRKLHYLPLTINILVPPLLMLALGIAVRTPGDDNTVRVYKQLKKLLYKSDTDKPVTVKLALNNRQKRLGSYFSIFYTIIFITLTYFTGYLLIFKLDYNLLSLGLFYSFLSLVLLFSYRIRWESQELTVAKQKRGVVEHVVSIFAMPFVNLGAWLSSRLSQINIFMFILDVIIDAPLKTLVRAVEEWSQFLKRKEEEMVEIPAD